MDVAGVAGRGDGAVGEACVVDAVGWAKSAILIVSVCAFSGSPKTSGMGSPFSGSR